MVHSKASKPCANDNCFVGLFQCFNGTADCTTTAPGPCPHDTILQMVGQGVGGGDACYNQLISARFDNAEYCIKYGLLQAYVEVISFGQGLNKAMAYYWTARTYNSGVRSMEAFSGGSNTNLRAAPGGAGVTYYSSHIGNFLVGRDPRGNSCASG